MKTHSIALASVAALALGTGGALAQTSAMAVTDLNVRSGPGPIYEIVDVIPAEGEVAVAGCVETADWCEVTLDGQTGWSYAPYLRMSSDETMLDEAARTETVAIVEYQDDSGEAAVVSGGVGAAVGAAIAGPLGAVAGGVLGSVAGGVAVQPEVTVYAAENPVDPVFLDGEPVIGATVPTEVEVHSMPEFDQYAYLNINGDTVVIDNESREIVSVVR